MDLRSFKPIVRADEKSGAQLASHPKRFGLHFSGIKQPKHEFTPVIENWALNAWNFTITCLS